MPKPNSKSKSKSKSKPKSPSATLDFDFPRDDTEHRRLDRLIDAYLELTGLAALSDPPVALPDLDTVFHSYLEAHAAYKEAERRLDRLKPALAAALDRAGIDTITVSGVPIHRIKTTRSTIDRMLLLGLGVLPSLITQATRSTSSVQLRIGKPGSGPDQEPEPDQE